MKLKIINFDSKNVFGSIKQAVFTSALSYGKMYELLHKQLWRKAPYRITIATLPVLSTFKGRPVGFVRKWDIKSPSKLPYSYDGGDHSFGLNQLFVGQDYRQWYSGDPKSGIYHDDCYIEPKKIVAKYASNGYRHMWIYCSDVSDDGGYTYTSIRYYQENYDGSLILQSVTLNFYTVETVPHVRIVVVYADGTVENIELGVYDPATYTGEMLYGACDNPDSVFGFSTWSNPNTSFDEHGQIVFQQNAPLTQFNNTRLWAPGQPSAWIRVYEDGTVIQYRPAYSVSGKDGVKKKYSASYSILPMIFLDTGDLAMDRVEFVDKWDQYFELFVHEDSEWWTGLIRPLSLIIAAIIIYLSWGSLSPLAKAIVVIGYVVYAAGVITNNTDLMLIGGIMMAGVSIYTAVEAATTTTAATSAQLSTMSTEQALASTSFSETFSGYASAAGMENLLVMPTVESYTSLTLEGLATSTVPYAELGAQAGMSVADYVSLSGANAFSIDSLMSIGKELYSAYNNTNQLLKKNTTSSSKTSDTSDDSGVRITIKNSDEEDDVMQYIKKVIDIL